MIRVVGGVGVFAKVFAKVRRLRLRVVRRLDVGRGGRMVPVVLAFQHFLRLAFGQQLCDGFVDAAL